MFRRRFGVPRELYERIRDVLVQKDNYFVQRTDCFHQLGLSANQKMLAALHQLSFGYSADACDEYLRLAESTAMESLKRFCSDIVEYFGDEYLRSPTADDMVRIQHAHSVLGFPGMLGSLDCMHWAWKNCPTAWAGAYKGRDKQCTVVLQAVADDSRWIWHAFFGVPGTMNDINVMERSDLFADLYAGTTTPVEFTINGRQYNRGYYLGDGIYPQWATIVKAISQPQGQKQKLFVKRQESARKAVECAFGILQSRFAIVRQPARSWNKSTLKSIITACIILHNMNIEYNQGHGIQQSAGLEISTMQHANDSLDSQQSMEEFSSRFAANRDSQAHHQLRNDLIEHMWNLEGSI
jgi:Plant transposon protein